MKLIKTIIATLAICLTIGSISGQSKGSVNIGLQYFAGEYNIKNTNFGGEVASTMLAFGGEYKYAKFLSGEAYLGILGNQGIGTARLEFRSAQIAPIRLHFGKEGLGGFYIGPKLFMQSVSDYQGATVNGIEIGTSLGFNIVSQKIPIIIGLNASVSGGFLSEFGDVRSGIITIGYQL